MSELTLGPRLFSNVLHKTTVQYHTCKQKQEVPYKLNVAEYFELVLINLIIIWASFEISISWETLSLIARGHLVLENYDS